MTPELLNAFRHPKRYMPWADANARPEDWPSVYVAAEDYDRLLEAFLKVLVSVDAVRSAREADEALAAGRTRPMSAVLADMADKED